MAITDWLSYFVSSWVGSWLISGCAIETSLLLTSSTEYFVSNYLLAACLNAAYLLASTSWLFGLLFGAGCWPLIGLTCLVQYSTVSSYTRATLRRTLRNVHFYRDQVALFYLPSMVIDLKLDGRVTVRGLTISLLDLTIQLHGLEVGKSSSIEHSACCLVCDGTTLTISSSPGRRLRP
jgi:hypothetical protein